MSETFETMIDIVVAVIIIFIFPILYYGIKQDILLQTIVSHDTNELVYEIERKGYLTKEMYEAYTEDLSDTGLLYRLDIKHKKFMQEPEYRLRSEAEIINQQNSSYAGTNIYTYIPVTTLVPEINDPVNNQPLNKETNASILASSTGTPADLGHVHTSACYIGHRHTESCVICGDMTRTVNYSNTSSYYPSEARREWAVVARCSYCRQILFQINGCYYTDGRAPFQYYMTYYCYTSSGTITDRDLSFRGGLSSNWYDSLTQSEKNTYNAMREFISLMDYRSRYPTSSYVSGPYYTSVTDNMSWSDPLLAFTAGCDTLHYVPYIGCVYCGAYGSFYSCGSVQDTIADCGSIISSILPTHAVQTVAAGDPLITTVTAVFQDGSTKVVEAASDFSTLDVSDKQTATLTYTYQINGIMFTRNCSVLVTVIPRTRTCNNGHIYHLGNDGTDSGCPYCKAWLSSLVITYPMSGPLTIYQGTTLEDNGVTVCATYMDGHTQVLYDGYVDNLDSKYIGSQNVTIGYKGKTVNLTVITKRVIELCNVCKRYYELYPDLSDPGCPYCLARTPIFTGNVMKYYCEDYLKDVQRVLFEEYNTYYFKKNDLITIQISNETPSWGRRLLSNVFRGLGDTCVQVAASGNVREDGGVSSR